MIVLELDWQVPRNLTSASEDADSNYLIKVL